MWRHKKLLIPCVPHSTGIGGGIDSRPEVGLRTPAARRDVEILAFGKGCCFLDADYVVFKPQVSIDIALALEMSGDDFAAVGEGEHSALHAENMRKVTKEAGAKGLEVFQVRLAHFAEQEA